jgi:hypothetical protein
MRTDLYKQIGLHGPGRRRLANGIQSSPTSEESGHNVNDDNDRLSASNLGARTLARAVLFVVAIIAVQRLRSLTSTIERE